MKRTRRQLRKLIQESIRDVDQIEAHRSKMIEYYEKEKSLNIGKNEEAALDAQQQLERYYSMSLPELIQDMDASDRIDILAGSVMGTGQQITNSDNNLYKESLECIAEAITPQVFNSLVSSEYSISQQSESLNVNGIKVYLPIDMTGDYAVPLARIADILYYEGILNEALSNIPLNCLIATISAHASELKYSSLSQESSYEYEDEIRSSAGKSTQEEIREAYHFAIQKGSDDFANEIDKYIEKKGPGLRFV